MRFDAHLYPKPLSQSLASGENARCSGCRGFHAIHIPFLHVCYRGTGPCALLRCRGIRLRADGCVCTAMGGFPADLT
jgi:hypothetical protein